ncbi:MAG TPA: tetratricopeptide repeat protein, partial [bacterium]|nr:tetratricopeptide repeat protein [bacterium]
ADAMTDLRTVLSLVPDDTETTRNLRTAKFLLGLSLARQNKYQLAYDVFQELLQGDPDSVEIAHNVALLAAACEKYAEAVRMWKALFAHYQAQLDKVSEDEYLAHLIVEIQKKIAENSARIPAEKPEEKTVFAPQAPDAKTGVKLAVSLMEQKLYAQALQILERAMSEGDNSLDVVDNLGWAYLHMGNIEESFRLWRKGLRDHNQHPRLKDSIIRGHVHVGRSMLEGNHITPALTHLKQALAADSKNIEAYDLLAQIYLQKGDPMAAIDLWTKALKIDPRDKKIQRSIRAAKIRTRR